MPIISFFESPENSSNAGLPPKYLPFLSLKKIMSGIESNNEEIRPAFLFISSSANFLSVISRSTKMILDGLPLLSYNMLEFTSLKNLEPSLFKARYSDILFSLFPCMSFLIFSASIV